MSGQGWMGPMLWTVKWMKIKISCGGVIDLAVEQQQLFRKLNKNKIKPPRTYPHSKPIHHCVTTSRISSPRPFSTNDTLYLCLTPPLPHRTSGWPNPAELYPSSGHHCLTSPMTHSTPASPHPCRALLLPCSIQAYLTPAVLHTCLPYFCLTAPLPHPTSA